jgi:hypothetical protein
VKAPANSATQPPIHVIPSWTLSSSWSPRRKGSASGSQPRPSTPYHDTLSKRPDRSDRTALKHPKNPITTPKSGDRTKGTVFAHDRTTPPPPHASRRRPQPALPLDSTASLPYRLSRTTEEPTAMTGTSTWQGRYREPRELRSGIRNASEQDPRAAPPTIDPHRIGAVGGDGHPDHSGRAAPVTGPMHREARLRRAAKVACRKAAANRGGTTGQHRSSSARGMTVFFVRTARPESHPDPAR